MFKNRGFLRPTINLASSARWFASHGASSSPGAILSSGADNKNNSNNNALLKRNPVEIAQRAVCVQLLLTRWGIEAAWIHQNRLAKGNETDQLKQVELKNNQGI